MSKRARSPEVGIPDTFLIPRLSDVLEILSHVKWLHVVSQQSKKSSLTDVELAFRASIVAIRGQASNMKAGPQPIVTELLTSILEGLETLFEQDKLAFLQTGVEGQLYPCLSAIMRTLQTRTTEYYRNDLQAALVIDDERTQEILRQRIRQWLDLLEQLPSISPPQDDSYTSRKRPRTLIFGIAENIELVFKALHRVQCKGHKHNVYILLATLMDEERFDRDPFVDILISAVDNEDRWEEVRVVLPITWDRKIVTINERGARPRMRPLIKNFCEELSDPACDSRRKWVLHSDEELLFNDGEGRFRLPWGAERCLVSLNDLITPRASENTTQRPYRWETVSKLSLAVILSHTLMHLFSGNGLRREWPRKDIHFVRKDDFTVLRPLLRSSDGCFTPYEAKYECENHGYPALVGFGVMLLEIYENEALSSILGAMPPSTLSRDLARLKRAFEKRKGGMFSDAFRRVIEFCMDPHFTFLNGDDKQGIKSQIYESVVRPFENELETNYAMVGPLERIDTRAFRMDLVTGRDIPPYIPAVSRLQAKSVSYSIDGSVLFSTTGDDRNVPEKSNLRRASTLGAAFPIDPTLAFSANRDWNRGDPNQRAVRQNPLSSSTQPSLEIWSDIWLADFNSIITKLHEHTVPHLNGNRVKIAILDTGIDRTQDVIRGYENESRIKRVCNFIDGADGVDENDRSGDEDGHGTHIASMILKWAPDVEVSIARVSRTRYPLDDSNVLSISKALEVARKEWAVDIINMSFGFDEDKGKIDKELHEASHINTLLFAAASNDGPRFNRTYPARRRQVFCIHSSDGFGKWSSFNPKPRSGYANLAILGENISSPWSGWPELDPYSPLTGSSYATALAVALSASILSWLKHEDLPPGTYDKMKSHGCMKQLLLLMTEPNTNEQVIEPKRLFGGKDFATVKSLILAELNPTR